jgi:hypothetical protein
MDNRKPSLASSIAPEDIRRGHYVAVLNVIDQYFPCCFDQTGTEPVNIRMRPQFQMRPLKVIDVRRPPLRAGATGRCLCAPGRQASARTASEAEAEAESLEPLPPETACHASLRPPGAARSMAAGTTLP